MDQLGLLLAYPDGTPVLDEPFDAEAASNAPRPNPLPKASDLLYPDQLNDLRRQGWGVVVPADDQVGNRLLSIMDPLIQARKDQTGRAPIVYKVPERMTAEQSSKWWEEVYRSEDVRDFERPRYLLILGDADLISWDFQQRMAIDAYIGRLAFRREDDYAAYAHKVIANERQYPVDGARALFHTVRDSSRETNMGHTDFMVPTVTNARQSQHEGAFRAKEIEWLDEDKLEVSAEDFLCAAARPIPTMLFSISHGQAAPKEGWSSIEEQHRYQGRMSVRGQHVSAEDVKDRPFLPGGIWFYFACLGAGTPTESAYAPWLADLKRLGMYPGSIERVLASLPKPGDAPFMARLPQAALANPNGPLSIVGHVDLAWTYGFHAYDMKEGRGMIKKNRPSQFESVFSSLVDGLRIGNACEALVRQLWNADADLNTIYGNEDRAIKKNEPLAPDPMRTFKKANTWMRRQDLSAYVLLGDPATRLAVRMDDAT